MTDNRYENSVKEMSENGRPKILHVEESDLEDKYNAKNLTVSLTKLPFEFDENGRPKALNSSAVKNYVTLYSDADQFQCSVCKKKYESRRSFSRHIYTHMETSKRGLSKNIFPRMMGVTRRSITRCMACGFLFYALYYYSTDILNCYLEQPSWFPHMNETISN